jgi:hypothetical protein
VIYAISDEIRVIANSITITAPPSTPVLEKVVRSASGDHLDALSNAQGINRIDMSTDKGTREPAALAAVLARCSGLDLFVYGDVFGVVGDFVVNSAHTDEAPVWASHRNWIEGILCTLAYEESPWISTLSHRS